MLLGSSTRRGVDRFGDFLPDDRARYRADERASRRADRTPDGADCRAGQCAASRTDPRSDRVRARLSGDRVEIAVAFGQDRATTNVLIGALREAACP